MRHNGGRKLDEVACFRHLYLDGRSCRRLRDGRRRGGIGAAAADRLEPDCHVGDGGATLPGAQQAPRSEEHTSELQSLMRTSYAVFCLKKKKRVEKTRLNRKIIITE